MDFNSLIGLSLICAAGAVSPGPSLAVVVRNTISGGKTQGVLTGIGHGIGLGSYAFIAITGLSTIILTNVEILKSKTEYKSKIYCGKSIVDTHVFKEQLLNKKKYLTTYYKNGSYRNSDEFVVPKDHYFFLGDNRDCSKDSRFLTSVGYVHKDNLVGKAQFIFFSTNIKEGSVFNFWNWKKIIRIERFFKKIV